MFLLDGLTTLQNTEIVFKIIESIATTIALIAGGVWAYFRFIRQRENSALINFSVEIRFVGNKDSWWVVEILAYIENKGKVQHRVKDFTFELAALYKSDNVEVSPRFSGQVFFPHDAAKGSFLSEPCKYFFIEPGLKNKYTYVARVSDDAEMLMLHSTFKYLDGKRLHRAEVTVKVPDTKTNLK